MPLKFYLPFGTVLTYFFTHPILLHIDKPSSRLSGYFEILIFDWRKYLILTPTLLIVQGYGEFWIHVTLGVGLDSTNIVIPSIKLSRIATFLRWNIIFLGLPKNKKIK